MNFYLFTAILILFTYLYFKYLKPAPKKETPPTKIELTQVKKEPTKEKEEKKEEPIEEPKEETITFSFKSFILESANNPVKGAT